MWVPGRFRLTNQMLHDLRAAGKYEAAGARWGRMPRGGFDRFAIETAEIRLAVKVAARGALPCMHPAEVAFIVFGHRKHDPDAWYLLAKAAMDGLVDAGVFASDRFGVLTTSGAVLRDAAAEDSAAERLEWKVPLGQPGVAIVVQELDEEGCGHA